jgi:hypothetical protein
MKLRNSITEKGRKQEEKTKKLKNSITEKGTGRQFATDSQDLNACNVSKIFFHSFDDQITPSPIHAQKYTQKTSQMTYISLWTSQVAFHISGTLLAGLLPLLSISPPPPRRPSAPPPPLCPSLTINREQRTRHSM